MILDEFQTKAIDAFKSGKNIIVTANTGSGKTLIATKCIDHLLASAVTDQAMREIKIWYTTPIKALSNEKYSDFRKMYGAENVGLLTGDIKVNPDAKIVIATMEILNNSLLSGQINLSDLSDINRSQPFDKKQLDLVIFDEAHYLNDPARGYVWEESLILLSRLGCRVVLLSATISNSKLLKKWLESIFKKDFEVVTNSKRVVPLSMRLVTDSFEFIEPSRAALTANTGSFGKTKPTKGSLEKILKVLQNKDLLPVIVWILSRKKCETQALGCDLTFTDAEERRRIEYDLAIFERQLEVSGLDKPILYVAMRDKLIKGVACHHAGMNALLREFVEYLFKKKLIKVVFATETFSVGINFPARSVLFTSLMKPGTGGIEQTTDRQGGGFRMFTASEFIQMAGRAGRRGIDTTGHVFIMPHGADSESIISLIKAKPASIKSRYRVTYSSVLQSYPIDLSTDTFNQSRTPEDQEFKNVCRILEEHDFIGRDGQLTRLGQAARCFNDIDPLLAVMILEKVHMLSGREIIRSLVILNSGVSQESVFPTELNWVIDLENALLKTETRMGVTPSQREIGSGILDALDLWAKGKPVHVIVDKTNIDEGTLMKELQKIKNISVSVLRALYALELPDSAQRVYDSLLKLFRRELHPDSFVMRS